jgi:hypothetical protein
VINPPRGWLANWNNMPSVGWTVGDAPATERIGGPLHRGEYLVRLVRRLARSPSYAALKAVDRRAGTIAQQQPLLGRRLREVSEGATGSARVLLDTVLAWDGSYDRVDGAGTVDPGWRRGRRSRTRPSISCRARRGAGSGSPAGCTSSTSAALT